MAAKLTASRGPSDLDIDLSRLAVRPLGGNVAANSSNDVIGSASRSLTCKVRACAWNLAEVFTCGSQSWPADGIWHVFAGPKK
mmetsp:Transcript_26748/g.63692  ORF Transcript_26748/g.63692 Transcript_26748/m.63692 type:complete len:83 (-) Transcript_26748:119-367(-)